MLPTSPIVWAAVASIDFDPRHLLHIGPISGKPIQRILAGSNGGGMPIMCFAAREITDMVKEEEGHGQTGRSRLSRTSQVGLLNGEDKVNLSSGN